MFTLVNVYVSLMYSVKRKCVVIKLYCFCCFVNVALMMGRYGGRGELFFCDDFFFLLPTELQKKMKKKEFFVRVVSIIIGALSSQKKTESGGRTGVCIY